MESSNKSRLGKGLGALIEKTKDNKEYIIEAEISKVKPNPMQPRKKFDEKRLGELAESIKENGIIQPIIVRKKNNTFEIIAGERRFRAAQLSKLKKIPIIVRVAEEDESLELAIIENVQRENLNPIEEGEAYKLLIDKYSYTQDKLAKKLGKNRSTITNIMRILKLPDSVKSYMEEGKVSQGHARALLSLKDEFLQIKLADKIVAEELSVREVEDIVKGKKEKKKKVIKDNKRIEIIEIEGRLKDFLGTKVKIKEGKNTRGKMEIEFYSEGDLERILETIGMLK